MNKKKSLFDMLARVLLIIGISILVTIFITAISFKLENRIINWHTTYPGQWYRVFEDGTTERFSCKALINLCRSFSPISKRYSDRRDELVPYSLDEVIELLLKA